MLVLSPPRSAGCTAYLFSKAMASSARCSQREGSAAVTSCKVGQGRAAQGRRIKNTVCGGLQPQAPRHQLGGSVAAQCDAAKSGESHIQVRRKRILISLIQPHLGQQVVRYDRIHPDSLDGAGQLQGQAVPCLQLVRICRAGGGTGGMHTNLETGRTQAPDGQALRKQQGAMQAAGGARRRAQVKASKHTLCSCTVVVLPGKAGRLTHAGLQLLSKWAALLCRFERCGKQPLWPVCPVGGQPACR